MLSLCLLKKKKFKLVTKQNPEISYIGSGFWTSLRANSLLKGELNLKQLGCSCLFHSNSEHLQGHRYFTTSLSNLVKCLTSHRLKKFFSLQFIEISCCNLSPMPLILLLYTSKNYLASSLRSIRQSKEAVRHTPSPPPQASSSLWLKNTAQREEIMCL